MCALCWVCFPIQQRSLFLWFLINLQFENHFSLPFFRMFLDVCVPAKLLQLCLTLQLYGLQPVRLLCPWDSPGKNTAVSCRALLQGIFLTQGSNLCLLHWQGGSLLPLPSWKFMFLDASSKLFGMCLRYNKFTKIYYSNFEPLPTLFLLLEMSSHLVVTLPWLKSRLKCNFFREASMTLSFNISHPIPGMIIICFAYLWRWPRTSSPILVHLCCSSN